MIGVYAEGGKVKVAFHKLWKGGAFRLKKLNLSETVIPYLENISINYNLRGIYFDPWQAVHLAEGLREKGIACYEVTQTHSNRGPKDTALYEMCSNGALVLYDDDELRYAASGANAKELPDGKLFLQKAGGRSKIDLLVALSNVADVAYESEMGRGGMGVIPDIFDEGVQEHLETHDWVKILGGRDYVWVDRRSPKVHKPGITSENCRWRNAGCYACVKELQGFYKQQEEMGGDITPMSEEQFLIEQNMNLGYTPPTQEEMAAERTRRRFWRQISRKKGGKNV